MGLWDSVVLRDISFALPTSRYRAGVVPFRQTKTDCQPLGVSQEAMLVSAICQVVLAPTNAVFLPRDCRGEGEKLQREAVICFFSLSFVTEASEGIFLSGYSASEGYPREWCICLENVTQAMHRLLPGAECIQSCR